MDALPARVLAVAWTASGAVLAAAAVPVGAPTFLALACVGATLALACVLPTPHVLLSDRKRQAALCLLLALAPIAAANAVFAGITVFSRL